MSTNNIIFLTKMMVVVIENVCGEVVKVHSTPSHHPNFPIIILILLITYLIIIIIKITFVTILFKM